MAFCATYAWVPLKAVFERIEDEDRYNCSPVSYTHLDVYKRQGLFRNNDYYCVIFKRIWLQGFQPGTVGDIGYFVFFF